MLLGVLGVEVLGGVLGRWWGLWRENWLYLWITATAREVVQCCCGRRLEQWAAYGVPVGVWWVLQRFYGRVLLRLWRCFLLRHQLHKSCLGLLLVANPLQLNR